MKTLKTAAIVLGLFALLAGTTTLVRAQDYQDNYQDDGYNTGDVSLQTFYDELSPYGTWIQDPQYGYVWRPDVDQNEFRPYYTNGRWAMTEYGNTWVSNYDWGWAPFHYGRWVINSYRQWIWMPDTNWGPAWVDWRSGDGQYGWAPMAPSININLSFGRRYVVPEFCWNFIPQSSIYINAFPRYDYGRNNVYIRNTTIINNTYVYNRRNYYGGPRVEDIRRATNRNVTVYRFDQSSRPGASRVGGREVSIYRPRPERNADNRNAAPRKFEQGNAGFNRGGRDNNNNSNRPAGNNNDNRFGQRNDNRGGQPERTSVGRDNNNQPNNRGDVYNRNATGRTDRGNSNGNDQRNGTPNVAQDQQRAQQMQQQRNERNGQDRMGQDQQRAQRDVQSGQQRSQADQQRAQQMQQQRSAQGDQQRAQRDAQVNQQRGQADQQRAQMQQQRAAQDDQQKAQRDAQVQQQRNQQADQQRSQQAQQQQQQRAAQVEQQRAQRDAQVQQQRNQQADQQRSQQAQQQQQQQRAQQEQQRQQRVERPVETRQAPPQQQNTSGERSGSEGGRPSRGGRG